MASRSAAAARPVFGVLLLSAIAGAQQLSIDFDPVKTAIHWSLAGNVHTTHGTFRLKRGHVEANVLTGLISGEIVADAASGDSGNSSRDKKMNQEILESGRFSELRFIPQKLEGALNATGSSAVRITGDFTIHGTTHRLTIPVDVSIRSGAFNGTGKFSVPYVDWGMKDPSKFVLKVDQSVEVEVVAVGRMGLK